MIEHLRQWFAGKRVFVTGHTGFKGSWLCLWLQDMGARVHGYALAPDEPSLFKSARVGDGMDSTLADIRDQALLERCIVAFEPEIVLHLAAQSLVRRSYADPCATFDVNVTGTANVLQSIRRAPSVKAAVIVTSDKCYENANLGGSFREEDAMGGADPYSASKGCAELVTSAFARSYFSNEGGLSVASVRAGNVIGGGDWAEDRLIPDLARAAIEGRATDIRRPDAIRPWQFVLEPLRGYLEVAQRLAEHGREFSGAWNFGPSQDDMTPVRDVVARVAEAWPAVHAHFATDTSGPEEAQVLRLDCSKAATRLGWRPALDLNQAIELTVSWYRAVHDAPERARHQPVATRRLRSTREKLRGMAMSKQSAPVSSIRVPYGKAVHDEAEIAAVTAALRTSTQMGASVRTFEGRVAALFDKKYGVMVNSGSSANYLAVELLALPPEAEVITPVLTFGTTVAPLVKNNLTPVFVDVEPDTFNIDVSQIETAIGPRTRAMMIPSLIGNLPDWDAIASLARKHDLLVVEDSADTLGATLRGRSTGARSDISTTSFYGSHVINCAGNGGMLCVNRDDWRKEATLLRSWGRDSSLFTDSEAIENRFNVELEGIAYDAKFVFSRIGYNLEPSEIGAAFGLVQLDRLASNIAARERNFEAQSKFFVAYEDWFILPRQMAESTTGWLAFPLIVRDNAPFKRRDLQIFLEQRGIQTRTVFTGNVLRQPAYKNIRRRELAGGYPNADQVMRGGMLTACHHGLSQADLEYVQQSFREFAKAY